MWGHSSPPNGGSDGVDGGDGDESDSDGEGNRPQPWTPQSLQELLRELWSVPKAFWSSGVFSAVKSWVGVSS